MPGGYDAVVDVDVEGEGDLGHTDLQEDLEFHSSTFNDPNNTRKPNTSGSSSFFPPGNSSSPSSSGKSFLWSLSFYAQYFDVDTSAVLARCQATLYPRANFLDVMEGNPDLYGPFWIATTVVVILFLTGTISQYLAQKGSKHFIYDFELLSGAAGLVYGYTFVIPPILWGVVRYLGSEGANLLEMLCLYGYGNLVWIAVALISWSPITILNYVFVAVGFAYSSAFLVRNLYPVLSATRLKSANGLLIVVVGLHAGLAIAIKVLFFASGSPAKKQKEKSGDEGKEVEEVVRLVRRMIGW
ncbi:MAG: hypothetical protein M1814_001027 [Vezdaea aestivalis]|nr:MAG: hypothetical protein M1814_001027 [Vezdaea aestivalis]